MASSQGKVIGGDHLNASIMPNLKGDLALTGQGFRRTPNLVPSAVESWEETYPEVRAGAGGLSRVSKAVARAALPGFAGKAASAAVGAAADSARQPPHTIRVNWVGGGQSLIELPEKLFQHLAVVLRGCQIASTPPPPSPTPAGPIAASGVVAKVARFVSDSVPEREQAPPGGQLDIADQIAKLAVLRDQGVLTDEEFAAKKTDLLSRL